MLSVPRQTKNHLDQAGIDVTPSRTAFIPDETSLSNSGTIRTRRKTCLLGNSICNSLVYRDSKNISHDTLFNFFLEAAQVELVKDTFNTLHS